MARIQQKTTGKRFKRPRTEALAIQEGCNASLTRHGQPPARWGEFKPKKTRSKPPIDS